MRKLFYCFFIILMCFSVNVSAAALGENIEAMLKLHDIEITDDTSYADKFQNKLSNDEKKLVSAAIKNNLIICKNKVINLKGSDLTPLIDAAIYRSLQETNVNIIAGTMSELEKDHHITFKEDTIFITENMSRDDLNSKDIYTCTVTADNKVEYIWKAGRIIKPAVYRGKLYWAENNIVIISDAEKKTFREWDKVGENFVEMTLKDLKLNNEFLLNNLDVTFYFLTDSYKNNIKIYGMAR